MAEIDLYFSDDGDFILDENKDIMDTSYDETRSLIQGIKARLNFNRKEWPGSSKNIGAQISDFVGLPNTKETGDKIKSRIVIELTKDGFISNSSLNVDIIPLSKKSILCKIMVKVKSKVLVYNYQFSFREKPPFDHGDVDAI